MSINKIRLLLCISIFATLLSALVTFIASRVRKDSVNWIMHTHEVIEKIEELQLRIVDCETGQRGFLLTENKLYLEPYNKSIHTIKAKLDEIDSLTRDNPNQIKNIKGLKPLVELKIILLDSTLRIYQSQGKSAAMNLINTGQSNQIMGEIRHIIDGMIAVEQKLLVQRFNKMGETISIFNTTRYISMFFIAIMTTIALVVLIRKDKQNGFLISKLNEINATLEQKVIERTKDLQQKNEEISAQSHQIDHQNEELEKQNTELTKMNAEKNKFLGIATHDLKSPINRVKGLLTIMSLSPEAPVSSQKEYFGLASKAIDQMLELIANLLDINRIEQGERQLHLEPSNINLLINNVGLMFNETAQKKNIQLILQSQIQNLIAYTDKSVLLQIMENLVSNAIKFSFPNKTITIILSYAELGFRITIADQGQGIAKVELPMIFDKFNRLSTKPTSGENSTGLGLSIVKELVEELKGNIWCESEVGVGSTFYVDFPVNVA